MGGTSVSRRSGDYFGIPHNQEHLIDLLISLKVFELSLYTCL